LLLRMFSSALSARRNAATWSLCVSLSWNGSSPEKVGVV